jgi:hypothetical protein
MDLYLLNGLVLYFNPRNPAKVEIESPNVNTTIDAKAMFWGNSFIVSKHPAMKKMKPLPGNCSSFFSRPIFSRKKLIMGTLKFIEIIENSTLTRNKMKSVIKTISLLIKYKNNNTKMPKMR